MLPWWEGFLDMPDQSDNNTGWQYGLFYHRLGRVVERRIVGEVRLCHAQFVLDLKNYFAERIVVEVVDE